MTHPATIASLPTPALVVDLDVLESNIDAAARLVSATGKLLRPHVKTHRTPGLALRQLGPGALGVTCATVGEAEAMVAAGIDDVLVANEVINRGKLQRLAALARAATVTLAVDSGLGVEILSHVTSEAGVEVGVLVDVDVGLRRCGVEDAEAAFELATRVMQAPGIQFAGLMGYEGRRRASESDRATTVATGYAKLASVRRELEAAGIAVNAVSAGGTSTFHEALADPVITEVQAGTYALMELDLDDLDLPFKPAVVVVASVISRSAGRCVVDAGRKSIACDYGIPAPTVRGLQTVTTHEEHSILSGEVVMPTLGARVGLRPSHVRLTFNLHDVVCLARGERIEEMLPVAARGRSA